MKRNQKGEVVIATAVTYLVIAFAVIVTNGFQRSPTAKQEPVSQTVCHNYNNIGCK